MNLNLCLLLLLFCFTIFIIEPSFQLNNVHNNNDDQDGQILLRIKRAGGRRGGGGGRSRGRGGSSNQMNPLTLLLGVKVVALKAILIKNLIQNKMTTTQAPIMMMVNGTMMGRK